MKKEKVFKFDNDKIAVIESLNKRAESLWDFVIEHAADVQDLHAGLDTLKTAISQITNVLQAYPVVPITKILRPRKPKLQNQSVGKSDDLGF